MRFVAALLLIAGLAPSAHAGPASELPHVCDPIDPSACLLPWPNDYFAAPDANSDTGVRLHVSPLATPRNVAGVPIDPTDENRNDGFSPGALIVTRVPGLDTPEALVRTNPVGLTDLSRYADPDAPVVVLNARTGERHPVWVELDRSEDLDGNPPPPSRTALLIRPAVNFDEGGRYIVALRFLRNADGHLLAPRGAFRGFREGYGHPSRQAHFEDLFATLAAAGIARDDLYLAWDFTVASERNLSERMLSIRDAAFAELGDTNLADLHVDGTSPRYAVTAVTENPDARIARRIEGRVLVPCFLNAPGCPSGSRFAYATPQDTLPVRIPGNVMAAPFVCNIPSGARSGATFRPSLYGHGLFGDAGDVSTGKLYDLAAHGLMFCATDWSGMASEDIPNGVAILADISRFSTLADRMQQAMLNFLYLGRAMIHPDGFCADASFRFGESCAVDTSALYYNGGSQGGIAGGSLVAVAPDLTRGHLGVPAMNYSTLLTRSVDFDDFAQVMYRTYPDPLDRQIIYSLIQTLWDRAESDGYAHHIAADPLPDTPPHEVLLTPAFGDHQVTNWATDVMARTIGASMRVPAVDPGRHPAGEHAYWGIPPIASYPYRGSAMVVGEIGPLREEDGRTKGTPPPPVENVPNRLGVDPHGPDWSEQPDGYLAIASWLSPDSQLPAVCGDTPCYLDGWTGP